MGKKAKSMEGKKDGIQRRLQMAFMQVSIVLASAGTLGLIAMFWMASSYEGAMANYAFPQGDIGKAMTSFSEARSAIRGALGFANQQAVETLVVNYEDYKAEYNQQLDAIEVTMVTPEGHAAFDKIKTLSDGYWSLADEIVKAGTTGVAGDNEKIQLRVYNELVPEYDKVYAALDELMTVNVEKGDEVSKTMTALKYILLFVIAAIIIGSFMIALRVGSNIAVSIVKPLQALGERIKTFTHGDLHTPFPEMVKEDEIADMAEDCCNMAEGLSLVIGDADHVLTEMANGNFTVRTTMEEKYEGDFRGLILAMRKLNRQLSATLVQIDEASEQVSEGSGQLASSAQELAEGATEQAGAIEELTATIENVTGIAEESAENAEDAAERAKGAAVTANKSRQEMEELVGAMERITKSSEEIEDIINAIEEIASQTNLLSLNASIEAARAGEAGRGFAVVADQIGKLAADSAQSAVSTKELITKSLEEIRKGNQIVESTMISISEVLASMEEFSEISTGNATASRSQADMLKQIEEGIEQIAGVVQSNSAASEETSAISEELSAQAISLKEMVSEFQLNR